MVDIEHRLTQVEDRTKSNTHRLDEVERRQNNLDELVSTVKVLAVREEAVESDVKEIKKDVKEMNGKAGKKWDSLMNLIISAVAGGVVGLFLAQLGLA